MFTATHATRMNACRHTAGWTGLEDLEGRQLMSVAPVAIAAVAKPVVATSATVSSAKAAAPAPVVAKAAAPATAITAVSKTATSFSTAPIAKTATPAASVQALVTAANRAIDPAITAGIVGTPQGTATTPQGSSTSTTSPKGGLPTGQPGNTGSITGPGSIAGLTVNNPMAGVMNALGTGPAGMTKPSGTALGLGSLGASGSGTAGKNGSGAPDFSSRQLGDSRLMDGDTSEEGDATSDDGGTCEEAANNGETCEAGGCEPVSDDRGTCDATGCDPGTTVRYGGDSIGQQIKEAVGKAASAVGGDVSPLDNGGEDHNAVDGVRGMPNPEAVDPHANHSSPIAGDRPQTQPNSQPAPVDPAEPGATHANAPQKIERTMAQRVGNQILTDKSSGTGYSAPIAIGNTQLQRDLTNELKDPGKDGGTDAGPNPMTR